MLEFSKLKRIPTRYDAQKKFFSRYKIYYYFSSKWKEDNTHEYYLFDIRLSFEKNFEIMQKKFENIEGYWSLYIDGSKYPFEASLKIKKNIQLEFVL